jgi:uncharacterized protein (DUF2235 family)
VAIQIWNRTEQAEVLQVLVLGGADMPKNIVICCDGTNNSLTGPRTNVGYLHELTRIGDDSRQLSFYDAGVGVEADPKLYTRIGAAISRWSGSAFGTGMFDNIEQAYRYLVRSYQEGDRIFLFGFSRGAYTIRVIAGLLYNFGLLKPQFEGEAPKVIKAFQALIPRDGSGFVNGMATQEQQARFDEARSFRESRSVTPRVHFMGLFDTVSSLGWAWDPKSFPNTRKMPQVDIIRHALALDERRAKFRTNRIERSPQQDCQELWFAGVHSDVGGGYKPPRNLLARVPLGWMLREARRAGMIVLSDIEARLNLDASYLADLQAEQNESLTFAWRGLEYLPLPHRKLKDGKWVEGTRMYRCQGWREIGDSTDAHDSLQRRTVPVKNAHWASSASRIRFVS